MLYLENSCSGIFPKLCYLSASSFYLSERFVELKPTAASISVLRGQSSSRVHAGGMTIARLKVRLVYGAGLLARGLWLRCNYVVVDKSLYSLCALFFYFPTYKNLVNSLPYCGSCIFECLNALMNHSLWMLVSQSHVNSLQSFDHL